MMIHTVELTKTYGHVRAVDNLTFSVHEGEIFGLLGPNGAGKTTTIKMLTTLCKPTGGRCFINGFDVVTHPYEIKKYIGVVPQENNLDRELTAYENLYIYSMLHSVREREKKIHDALTMVGIWERKDTVVSKFSGGMQRRLLIARALLSDPSVLFLDEPSIGLDPQIRRQLWDIIRKSKIEGRTIILTTHYIEEAEALCDRVGILSKGRLIALGTPAQLRNSVGEYIIEYVDGGGKLTQHICGTRDEAYAMARHHTNGVTVRKSNLEDVFVKLTGERIE